jgi:hypothetical protein
MAPRARQRKSRVACPTTHINHSLPSFRLSFQICTHIHPQTPYPTVFHSSHGIAFFTYLVRFYLKTNLLTHIHAHSNRRPQVCQKGYMCSDLTLANPDTGGVWAYELGCVAAGCVEAGYTLCQYDLDTRNCYGGTSCGTLTSMPSYNLWTVNGVSGRLRIHTTNDGIWICQVPPVRLHTYAHHLHRIVIHTFTCLPQGACPAPSMKGFVKCPQPAICQFSVCSTIDVPTIDACLDFCNACEPEATINCEWREDDGRCAGLPSECSTWVQASLPEIEQLWMREGVREPVLHCALAQTTTTTIK